VGTGELLYEDHALQVFGASECAVLDAKLGQLRAQVELHLVSKKPSQQLSSVDIQCRVPDHEWHDREACSGLQVKEVVGHGMGLDGKEVVFQSERQGPVITRHFDIFLKDIFSKPPVAIIESIIENFGPDEKEMQAPRHFCEVPLPIDITAFLSPLPIQRSQSQLLWENAKCSKRWHVPDQIKECLDTLCREEEIYEAVACKGTLGRRVQDKSPVFTAELLKTDNSALGSNLVAIIALHMTGGPPPARQSLAEVVVRSEDIRLADAVLSVAVKHLTDLASSRGKLHGLALERTVRKPSAVAL
jgi:hypothetical protein